MIIKRNLILLLLIDTFFLLFSYYLAYFVRFEANIPDREWINFRQTVIPIILCKLSIFAFFNLYKGMWRYTGISDLLNIIKSIIISLMIIVSVIFIYNRFIGFPRSVLVIDAMLSLLFIAGIRLSIRLRLTSFSRNSFLHSNDHERSNNINDSKKLIIVGAGDAGEKVVREIQDNPRMKYTVIGFVDDHKGKIGKYIHGIKVFGPILNLPKIVEASAVDEILIAAPSTAGDNMRRIVTICESTRIPFKTLPGLGEIIDGKVSIKKIRDISYKDLLGRATVRLENEKISEYLKDKCVLVTGAGGSIGSELCRQICKYNPALVVLFDASESNLYSIQMELKHILTHLKFRAVLGRIQDKRLVDDIFNKYKPDVVFHAAAYKHVPLVERNPWEAVYTNIIGTNTIINAVNNHNIKRFVLVSTDKAVRPTNVMGASKRVIEKILQIQQSENTRFMAVRFGNVIGSSGSVIPLFRDQIERGGPLTVTHPEVTRYFMTIQEAARLILQAVTMGEGGEIFILEMGIPVKIADMARDLIRLSGKEPGVDIEIKYIGLRPGEKLYEELITEGEGIVKTDHENIMVLRKGIEKSNVNHDAAYFEQKINELSLLADKHDSKGIKLKLKEIVPEYEMSDDEAVI